MHTESCLPLLILALFSLLVGLQVASSARKSGLFGNAASLFKEDEADSLFGSPAPAKKPAVASDARDLFGGASPKKEQKKEEKKDEKQAEKREESKPKGPLGEDLFGAASPEKEEKKGEAKKTADEKTQDDLFGSPVLAPKKEEAKKIRWWEICSERAKRKRSRSKQRARLGRICSARSHPQRPLEG